MIVALPDFSLTFLFSFSQYSDANVCVSNGTEKLGPVVQSVVSLTGSLRVISLTVLADSIYTILIFLLKKCE